MKNKKTKLWNRDLCLIAAAVFLMFTAFYMLMPIIAMYVIDEFGASVSVAGAVVSVYIVSAIIVRPFSGYLVDKYDRKKFYFITYLAFALLCIGYLFVTSITMLIVLRILLGITFSLVTTAGSTLSIDLMPSDRRGEGIGYFGAITVLAMAVGPMLGLYFMEIASYEGIFTSAVISCMLGVICAYFIKSKSRQKGFCMPMSLDRFYLKSATSLAVFTIFINFPYGILVSYMPLYLKESGVDVTLGNFFMCFTIGVVLSRLLAGKLINRGLQNMLVQLGIMGLITSLYIFTYQLNEITFIISSLMMGASYGLISPSVQSLIINLVSHSKRGTANSTYFIALDIGAGLGMFLGGFIAELTNYQMVFIIAWITVIVGLSVYKLYSYRNYMKQLSRVEVER